MGAFMIVYARVDDPVRFGDYVAAVQPLIARHGGKLVGRAAPPVVLEGDWPWGTVGIVSFPSIAAARTFWDSPEYEEVKKLRQGASEFQVVLAEMTPS